MVSIGVNRRESVSIGVNRVFALLSKLLGHEGSPLVAADTLPRFDRCMLRHRSDG